MRWQVVSICVLTAAAFLAQAEPPSVESLKSILIEPNAILDSAGGRGDKNSVGHGGNVAIYTGSPSKFFFATHELGDVFSAVDGQTIRWWPDQVIVGPNASKPIVEQRQVCVTADDVVVSRFHLSNPSNRPIKHRIEVTGDCRKSFDWRNKPGGEKISRRDGDFVVLIDKNVFPEFMPDGLAMVVGGDSKPDEVVAEPAGTYRLVWNVEVPANSSQAVTLACAIDPNVETAKRRLEETLKQPDPLAENRRKWADFYENDVPKFECSDAGLNELYAFRWFLLKFSTAGGNLGLFKHPVVMEGRQAFQTYCCYSAPFMAFDMNWAVDPNVGFGHIATMAEAAYDDGRFPWYVSPRTNQVPLDHASKTGLSLLQHTAWRWWRIHHDTDRLRSIYPALAKNMRWWIKDRDPDGNGLFEIDHQLETGMDDLHRRWKGGEQPPRYEAVDATTYAVLNLHAVANMARVCNQGDDADYFAKYAQKSAAALNSLAWDGQTQAWRDRNPKSGELSDYTAITIFYPLMTDAPSADQLSIVRKYLLSDQHFWLPHPLPALSQSDPEFDPVKRYWAGPSWPAATSHVIEGFATTAKRLDRSLLPQAAELLKRAASNHLQPRADFYERYDPFTGKPLSTFRDYMHSWWIDIFIRHVAGMTPMDDGSLVIDPLPLGLTHFALENAPFRGHKVDVLFNTAERGLTVRIDRRVVLRDAEFVPGAKAVSVEVP